MITVTNRAKEELKRTLSEKTDNPQKMMRLVISHTGEFRLKMDYKIPDDRVVEYKGSEVLLIDREIANDLDEYTLAFEDKEFIMAKGPLSGFNKSPVTFSEKEKTVEGGEESK